MSIDWSTSTSGRMNVFNVSDSDGSKQLMQVVDGMASTDNMAAALCSCRRRELIRRDGECERT